MGTEKKHVFNLMAHSLTRHPVTITLYLVAFLIATYLSHANAVKWLMTVQMRYSTKRYIKIKLDIASKSFSKRVLDLIQSAKSTL